jgi:enoyl-CoA hydratase/carnithine racemase
MPGQLREDEPADGVLRLTISHPGRRGALDRAILDALAGAVGRAPERGVRCLVLTGEGGMFSSGYDLGDLAREAFADGGSGAEAEARIARPFATALEALDACDVPIVGALGGDAIGGGLELALACDLRVAAEGVRLAMPPARLGLVYSPAGLRRFVDVVGAARTRELFLLGRPVAAATAQAWGLVHAVAPEGELDAFALDWAGQLAANAPLALRGTKRVLRALLAAEGALAPEAEAELIELRRACFASDDFREGVEAWAARRPARWRGT